MKKRFLIFAFVLFSITAACSKKPVNSQIPSTNIVLGGMNTIDGVDELSYSKEKSVELTMFRSGDDYYIHRNGSNGWAHLEGEIPDEAVLEDFEFARLEANLTYMSGGIAGFSNAPMISKLNKFGKSSFETGYNEGIIEAYDSNQTCFSGIRVHENEDNGKIYCIVYRAQSGYRVYEDGVFLGAYDTAFEAEGAMGLRENPDDNTEYYTVNNVDLYVFRCGDTYLGYSRYEDLNNWMPILNSDYENEPTDFSLSDGECIVLRKAKLLRLNGGKEGYVNNPMILSFESTEECSFASISLSTSSGHWEEGSEKHNGEMTEYHSGEYLIIYTGGQYHVYCDKSFKGIVTCLGVFDNEDEVNEALGL